MFALTLLLTIFLHLSLSVPIRSPQPNTTTCDAKTFDIPWSLTDITLFTNPNVRSQGWIRFNFIDYNDRLQLETVCYAEMKNGTVYEGEGGYALCADTRVAFQVNARGVVMVERGYKDHCLGAPPYNTGLAFGQNKTSMPPPIAGTFGALRIQNEMQVAITAEA